jgi:hypothetical protein
LLLHHLGQNAMSDLLLPIHAERESRTATSHSPQPRPLFLRFVTWCVVMGWCTCVDWRTKRPFLTRATAHLSIIVLALAAIVLSGVGIPAPRAAVGGPSDVSGMLAFGEATSLEAGSTVSSTLPLPVDSGGPIEPADDVVTRLAVPHTTLPRRTRLQVIVYAIQPGDTILDIAVLFGLSPNTIVWSNREAINDAPWLIRPGIELFILPVDGVYHTTYISESVASIAATYEVEPETLYNEWNDLEEGGQPREGQLLVVPGGKGKEIEWEPPPKYPAPGPAGKSYGVCSGEMVAGPGGNGWFIYPTGSPLVSGWYFGDPRNPTHIGIDYKCHLGDPIYAADNGVVTIAGWNGGYGILVELNHGNGFVTRYGHFKVGGLAVGCGDSVYQGDLLGYCGSTGWSSGPHLHFEIRHNGVPQNPQGYLP